MKTIYKYRLQVANVGYVVMPRDAQILKVGFQREELFIWALVEPYEPDCDRHFRIMGTGHDFQFGKAEFIDTVFDPRGLVWHIFDAGEK